ncbi:MAG: tetratricopeptide repeat protein [Deltaproteobacteria bacterium]|nr:tetratricopeptide repeat protein [Deltaproteobacteria bacterium]
MLWALVALAVSAAAPSLEEDIDFQEGKRLVDELDYERAIFRFQKLSKSDRPAEQQAQVNAWLGLTYANLGDEAEAIKAFVVAIKLDPLVVLPPASPKIAQVFDKARKIARDEMRVDTDEDGILDAADKCPSIKENANGFQDDDGCPDEKPVDKPAVVSDVDGDGVPDVTDACPNVRGEAVLDGCPQAPPVVKGPPGFLIGGATALGLGAVGLGAGGVAGALALSQQAEAEQATFQDDRQRIKADADGIAGVANVGFLVGGVCVVAGAVLIGMSFAGGDA